MSGGLIGPEYDGQIRQTIIAVRQMRRVSTEMDLTAQSKAATRLVPHAVVLDAALPNATNSKLSPTSALATVLRWSVQFSRYVETNLQVRVWNHSESTSYDADTFGKADPIDGHYWFIGDCAPMQDRAAEPEALPPEEEEPP